MNELLIQQCDVMLAQLLSTESDLVQKVCNNVRLQLGIKIFWW